MGAKKVYRAPPDIPVYVHNTSDLIIFSSVLGTYCLNKINNKYSD